MVLGRLRNIMEDNIKIGIEYCMRMLTGFLWLTILSVGGPF
jgi:hypothetical protein